MLVCTEDSFALMTFGCEVVLSAPKYHRGNAVLDPSGRFVAAAHSRVTSRCSGTDAPIREVSVNLYSTADGALAFSQVMGSWLTKARLAFNCMGDQLVLTGNESVHVLTFSQAHMSTWMLRFPVNTS